MKKISKKEDLENLTKIGIKVDIKVKTACWGGETTYAGKNEHKKNPKLKFIQRGHEPNIINYMEIDLLDGGCEEWGYYIPSNHHKVKVLSPKDKEYAELNELLGDTQ